MPKKVYPAQFRNVPSQLEGWNSCVCQDIGMDEKDKKLLAGFHHTISEQLNARLSESPKFFGLLVVVATGYGYVLSKPDLSDDKELFVSATLLSYGAVLWASWYLAALSYGFRFLQNIQHCVEHRLEWNPQYVPKEDKRKASLVWTLPSIYHPHAAGLALVLLLICGIFAHHAQHWFWSPWCVWFLGLIFLGGGWGLMLWTYRYYFRKFRRKRKPPIQTPSTQSAEPADDDEAINNPR